MKAIELPFFGVVNLDVDEESDHDIEIEINGHKVSVDLNMEPLKEGENPENIASNLKTTLEQLAELECTAHDAIHSNYQHKEGAVDNHLEDWLYNLEEGMEFVEPKVQSAIANGTRKEKKDNLFKLLRINRIGLYPSEANFIVCDYNFGPDPDFKYGYCDEYVVVSFNKNRAINEVSTEG
ncbi:DUF2004 domain-containing protein [uncultured Microbulbifer sp.]|uniref:DUF2004 domain-containing protein n=1 Tax=uncultured Microbulbifer sp. TaxID=348147 RepID=UPI00262A5DCC|nr:DUF2004 domain-containing protein [uncultured Microbulbifer sp.]